MTNALPLLTGDEAQLLSVDMLTRRGTADAEALGVTPRRMPEVLSPNVLLNQMTDAEQDHVVATLLTAAGSRS